MIQHLHRLTHTNDGSVSVIMPLYNHERYVGHALESVFAQSVQPLEIIVVDDGSCDGSVAVVRALAAARPEIVRTGKGVLPGDRRPIPGTRER